MRPLEAAALAAVFNLLGPLVLGAAVANTVAGIVTVDPDDAIAVIGAGLAAAVAWNLLTWRLGLPSSSGHALIGGLVGAGLLDGGLDAVNWGGIENGRPVGVLGTMLALAVAPALGLLVALPAIRLARRARGARRAAGAARCGRASGSRRPGWRSATAPTTRRNRSASWRRCCWPQGTSTPWRRRSGPSPAARRR
jgi:PiT family inorganic phosphate transporter